MNTTFIPVLIKLNANSFGWKKQTPHSSYECDNGSKKRERLLFSKVGLMFRILKRIRFLSVDSFFSLWDSFY